MLKHFFLLLLLFSLSACAAPEPEPAEQQIIAMDTVMTFTAYGGDAGDAVELAVEQMRTMESAYSRTLPDSELSQLNASGHKQISNGLAELLQASLHYYETTGGAFDFTIAPVASAWGFTADSFQVPAPEELAALLPLVDASAVELETGLDACEASLAPGQSIDLGGIVKGYASDLAAQFFASAGVAHGKADMGGNILVWGTRPDGNPWRVGVRDPAKPDGLAGVLELEDAYAITSGGYQRFFEADGKTYHHIIDPATGYPAESGLTSVTVVAHVRDPEGPAGLGNGAMCDAYSTAFFIMGEEKTLEFWRNHQQQNDYEDAFDLILITEDGRLIATAGLVDCFTINQDSGYLYETVS